MPYYGTFGNYPGAAAQLKAERDAKLQQELQRAQAEAAQALEAQRILDDNLARLQAMAPPAQGYEDPERQMSVPEPVYGAVDRPGQQSVPETAADRRERAAWEWYAKPGVGYEDADRKMSLQEPPEVARLREMAGVAAPKTEGGSEAEPVDARTAAKQAKEGSGHWAINERGEPTDTWIKDETADERWARRQDPELRRLEDMAKSDAYQREAEKPLYRQDWDAYRERWGEPGSPEEPEPPTTTADLLAPQQPRPEAKPVYSDGRA